MTDYPYFTTLIFTDTNDAFHHKETNLTTTKRGLAATAAKWWSMAALAVLSAVAACATSWVVFTGAAGLLCLVTWLDREE